MNGGSSYDGGLDGQCYSPECLSDDGLLVDNSSCSSSTQAAPSSAGKMDDVLDTKQKNNPIHVHAIKKSISIRPESMEPEEKQYLVPKLYRLVSKQGEWSANSVPEKRRRRRKKFFCFDSLFIISYGLHYFSVEMLHDSEHCTECGMLHDTQCLV